MKLPYPEIIHKETFPDAWSYASTRLRRAKQCRLLQALIDPVVHWSFLAVFLFLSLGMLYTRLDLPGFPELFQKGPAFPDAWFRFSGEVLTKLPCPGFLPPLAWEILICLGISWLVPLALALALTALVLLLYRPRLREIPAGDDETAGAKALIGLLRDIKRQRSKSTRQNSAVTSFVFLIGMGLLLCVYLFNRSIADSALTDTILADRNLSIKLAVLVFGCFFLYGAANYPLMVLVRLLCRCRIPAPFAAKAENYLKSLLPPEEADTILSVPLLPEPKLWHRCRDALTSRLLQIGFVQKLLDNPMGFPVPLKEASFPDAWKWANKKLCWAKKKRLMAKAAAVAAYPFFTSVLLIFTYGNLYDLHSPLLSRYLSAWPTLVGLWEKARPVLYENTVTPRQQQSLQLFLLYLVPLAACAAVALIVALLYHPRRRDVEPSDSPQEQANKLCQLLQTATAEARPPKDEIRGFCHTAFACLCFLFWVMYIPFTLSTEAVALAGSGLLSQSVKYLVLAAMGFTLGYWVLRLPLTICIRLLSFCHVPSRALAEAESWLERCQNSQPEPNIHITEEKEGTGHAEV